MKIYFNSQFIQKLIIPNYLLGGFYGIGRLHEPGESGSGEFLEGGNSKVFIIDTILNKTPRNHTDVILDYTIDKSKDEFVLSINLSDQDNLGTAQRTTLKYSSMYFYYIDYMTNPLLKASDLFKTKDNQYPIELRRSSLAFKLEFDEVEMGPYGFYFNEIIHIPLKVDEVNIQVAASFKEFTEKVREELTHYNSTNLGALSYFCNPNDQQVITKSSGNEIIREHLSDVSNKRLNGTFKIKTNGVIQL